ARVGLSFSSLLRSPVSLWQSARPKLSASGAAACGVSCRVPFSEFRISYFEFPFFRRAPHPLWFSGVRTLRRTFNFIQPRGRRVSKSNGKLYWYGSGGEILAETDASGNTLNEYIFFAGKRVAILPAGGNAQYYIEDLLGSSRAMTQNNGTPCGVYPEPLGDADFDPYGGERPRKGASPDLCRDEHAYTNTCPQNYKFEGVDHFAVALEKERDTETGNDDFGARYYTSRFGRWLSADWSSTPVAVPYANLTNPQTLNLYAMVSDDPESFADLDGHCCWDWIPTIVNMVTSYQAAKADFNSAYATDENFRSQANQAIQNAVTLGATLGGSIAVELASVPGGEEGGTPRQSVPEIETPEISPQGSGGARGSLPDDANVVRGGSANPGGANSPEGIAAGTDTHPSGVKGFSAESAPGKSVEQLAKESPTTSRYEQVGCCTVGQVRKAGGNVTPTPGQSPNHATVSGLSPQKASELLTPTVANPAKVNPTQP
ncbi:MAG: RHS repeat-associated core domain-containing protein, partial [Candidatus Acidiferrum sp.]